MPEENLGTYRRIPSAACAALPGLLSLTFLLYPTIALASHGDADGNGKVDVEDARLVADFLVGNLSSLPDADAADVNRDGQVTTADALLIMQFAKGLRTGFDFQAPQVLATLPPDGATGVLLTSKVSVFFSEPISTTTLAGTLTVTDTTTGQLVAGSLVCSQDGVIEIFTPDEPLDPDRLYRVDVTTAIQDLEGNNLQAPLTATFRTQQLGTLELLSASGGSFPINSNIPPIRVRARDASGNPVKDVPITLTAKMGAGTFQPSGLRRVVIVTEADGTAEAAFRMGGQAFEHTVEIAAVGFASPPIFQAQATAIGARNLRIFAGNNQNCATGATAPIPLQTKATDAGGNAVPGVAVTYRLTAGDGNFGSSASSTSVTNSSGVASVTFTHGATPGTALVEGSFDAMVGQPPVFTLLGLAPRPSSPTAIVGTVINTDVRPLAGIKVFLVSNPAVQDQTDEAGAFRLEPVPAGKQLFVIDALDSPPIDGVSYANLEFEINVIEGQDNTIQMPAILPPLDPLSVVDVSETQGGTLTLRADPRWKLFLAPGQAIFADGSKTGRLFVTEVPADKIPMAPPEGKVARTFVAIEPPTVRFNPPADVQFPNSDNLAAGTVTEIFSFDHEVGLFVPIGRGQVSEAGSIIRSLPGEGMVHGGWHQSPPPDPQPTTTAGGTAPSGCSITNTGQTFPETASPFVLPGLPVQPAQSGTPASGIRLLLNCPPPRYECRLFHAFDNKCLYQCFKIITLPSGDIVETPVGLDIDAPPVPGVPETCAPTKPFIPGGGSSPFPGTSRQEKCDDLFEADIKICRAIVDESTRLRCFNSAGTRNDACLAGEALPSLETGP